MGELVGYLISLLVSILVSNIIYLISKDIVEKDPDKIREYSINKYMLNGAIAVFAIALYFKIGYIGLVVYGGTGAFLILIGIIDYYTRYVYLKIAVIGIIYSFVAGIAINGIQELPFIAIMTVFLIAIARFTGEWYGDIEGTLIVALVLQISGVLITFVFVGLICTMVAIKKRTTKCYVAVCPMIAAGYIATLFTMMFII